MADADKRIVKVLKVGVGYNIVQYEDNSVARRTGTFAARNNNPGNLSHVQNSSGDWVRGAFLRSVGALDLSGVEVDTSGTYTNHPKRFAIFPTYEMGRAAKAKLLFEGDKYKNATIAAAINTYAPPSENNTENYIRSVVTALNPASPPVTRDTVMSRLTPQQRVQFINAVEQVEGGAGRTAGSSPTTYIPGQSGTPISGGGTSALVGVGDYIQKTYVAPLEAKNQAPLRPFIDTLKTGADPLVAQVQQSSLYSDRQLDGELQLIGIMQGINDTLASEAKSNLTKIDGLVPAEAAFLVQKNLFEMSPDIMRQQMSANADTSGRVVDYSHAWRAPGKLAITADLMIPGISGLRIGQIFWVGRTYEHYKDYGAFQLFGLTENITIGRGWTTTIHSRFNAMPTQKIRELRSRSV